MVIQHCIPVRSAPRKEFQVVFIDVHLEFESNDVAEGFLVWKGCDEINKIEAVNVIKSGEAVLVEIEVQKWACEWQLKWNCDVLLFELEREFIQID